MLWTYVHKNKNAKRNLCTMKRLLTYWYILSVLRTMFQRKLHPYMQPIDPTYHNNLDWYPQLNAYNHPNTQYGNVPSRDQRMIYPSHLLQYTVRHSRQVFLCFAYRFLLLVFWLFCIGNLHAVYGNCYIFLFCFVVKLILPPHEQRVQYELQHKRFRQCIGYDLLQIVCSIDLVSIDHGWLLWK